MLNSDLSNGFFVTSMVGAEINKHIDFGYGLPVDWTIGGDAPFMTSAAMQEWVIEGTVKVQFGCPKHHSAMLKQAKNITDPNAATELLAIAANTPIPE
jgi:hypothetical protein